MIIKFNYALIYLISFFIYVLSWQAYSVEVRNRVIKEEKRTVLSEEQKEIVLQPKTELQQDSKQNPQAADNIEKDKCLVAESFTPATQLIHNVYDILPHRGEKLSKDNYCLLQLNAYLTNNHSLQRKIERISHSPKKGICTNLAENIQEKMQEIENEMNEFHEILCNTPLDQSKNPIEYIHHLLEYIEAERSVLLEQKRNRCKEKLSLLMNFSDFDIQNNSGCDHPDPNKFANTVLNLNRGIELIYPPELIKKSVKAASKRQADRNKRYQNLNLCLNKMYEASNFSKENRQKIDHAIKKVKEEFRKFEKERQTARKNSFEKMQIVRSSVKKPLVSIKDNPYKNELVRKIKLKFPMFPSLISYADEMETSYLDNRDAKKTRNSNEAKVPAAPAIPVPPAIPAAPPLAGRVSPVKPSVSPVEHRASPATGRSAPTDISPSDLNAFKGIIPPKIVNTLSNECIGQMNNYRPGMLLDRCLEQVIPFSFNKGSPSNNEVYFQFKNMPDAKGSFKSASFAIEQKGKKRVVLIRANDSNEHGDLKSKEEDIKDEIKKITKFRQLGGLEKYLPAPLKSVGKDQAGRKVWVQKYYTTFNSTHRGVLPPVLDSSSFRNTVAALKEMHKNNIVHRDIKPQNMLLNDDSSKSVLFTDFGHTVNLNTDNVGIKNIGGSPDHTYPGRYINKEGCFQHATTNTTSKFASVKLLKAADVYSFAFSMLQLIYRDKLGKLIANEKEGLKNLSEFCNDKSNSGKAAEFNKLKNNLEFLHNELKKEAQAKLLSSGSTGSLSNKQQLLKVLLEITEPSRDFNSYGKDLDRLEVLLSNP